MRNENALSVHELTDEEIVDALRHKDERVTRQYFYEYCRIAYCVYNKKYELDYKPGMDFFALAHEYYLALDRRDWHQLEDRKPGMSLRTWMINGFRFVILDKLKAYRHEMQTESFEQRVAGSRLRFDIADADYKKEVRQMVESLCQEFFGRDDKPAILLKMILVEGFKGKEVAQQLGMTPSAVTQRYQKLMRDVVIPYFKNYYVSPTADARFSNVSCMAELSATPPDIYCNRVSRQKNIIMDNAKRITPDNIRSLAENEIFVFGSNLAGMHGGGAARAARLYFGAVMGQGTGLQGKSYAIPTMQGGTETIQPYVDEFIAFAKSHPEMKFLVTRIGCGIAGFDAADIAPLFRGAMKVQNISLPKDFWDCLD